VNKLTGMEFTDTWRWTLTDEQHLPAGTCYTSRTSLITQYYINDCQNRFNVRIIDSPGHLNSAGIQVDDKIDQQFAKLFS
jgi:hypothetical protein